MAGRKSWDSLSPAYRARLSRGGISRSQYESGASLARARGHGATPEHPRDAARKPERYREYVQKRQKFKGGQKGPEDLAHELNAARDAAYYNINAKLGDYIKFREPTVRANVYGGITSESEEVSGMNLTQARWTAQADAEELRSRASNQYKRNPWFYH